jgi:hypothetical protein
MQPRTLRSAVFAIRTRQAEELQEFKRKLLYLQVTLNERDQHLGNGSPMTLRTEEFLDTSGSPTLSLKALKSADPGSRIE